MVKRLLFGSASPPDTGRDYSAGIGPDASSIGPKMSAASELLDRIIASDRAKARERYDFGCQCLVEQDFIQQIALHAGCDYEAAEGALNQLGPNVLGLVNSPTGRVVLGVSMMTPGSALIQTTIN